MPSTDDVQHYIERVENYVYASVTAVAAEVPHIGDSAKQLWSDITRYGPKLRDIKLPSLGDFEVPPPPPPPPPPRSFWDRSTNWAADHPWTVAGLGAGAVGATLLIGYKGFVLQGTQKAKRGKSSSERKQVVVVLGGDSPLAFTLIHELEAKGYIVIASASTSDAASEIEHKSNGYVRALVLDPLLPDSVPNFLRLLVSALSRRFPIDAGGDPHASPATMPYIHSVISLLSMFSPATPPPAPLEHLQLVDDYMPYLTTTHIVPMMVVQALLPLLRSTSHLNGKGRKKSIIFCVPAADARVGLPFAGASAMSAAATTRGAEILRREIAMAAATGDRASAMGDIDVAVMDVGAIETPPPTRRRMLGHDAHYDLDAWTDSERLAYGPAYMAMVEPNAGTNVITRRRPSHPQVFADKIIQVVSGGRRRTLDVFGYRIPFTYLTCQFMGNRYATGAGAFTYTLASALPTSLLDVILNLPYLLMSIRNAFLPVPPLVAIPREPLPATEPALAAAFAPAPPQAESPAALDQADSDLDADVESNASSERSGENSGVDGSWVSLGGTSATNNPWKG